LIVFWLPVAVGALIGKLRGGDLGRVVALPIKHLWLVLVVAALQVPLVFSPPRLPDGGFDPVRLLVPLSTWAIVGFAALNWRLDGMGLVLVGALANALVITANGGLMPVTADALRRGAMGEVAAFGEAHPGARLPRTKDVLLEPQETTLWWLSDVLVVPVPPLPRPKVMSLGDLTLAVGVVVLTVRAMRPGTARTASGGSGDDGGPNRTRRTDRWTQEDELGASDTIPPWVRPAALRPARSWAGGSLA
jgi:hypothetical protein